MSTVELLSHLRSLDVKLWLDGERLRYSAPSGVMTESLRAQVVERKTEIVAFLQQAQASLTSAPPIKPVARDQELPLSFAQQRLWLLDQLMPGIASYNVSQAVRLQGPLDRTALQRTMNEIVRRHEILRTSFHTVDGRPVQRIAPDVRLDLSLVDLQELPPGRREEGARRLAAAEATRPFDLTQSPLLRITLLCLEPEDHALLLTMHHIVSDGWSMGILVQEVASLYMAFVRNQPSPLADLPIQYADYAHWQRQWLQGEVLERHLSYWKEQLRGAPAVLDLPTDHPRPAMQTFRGAHHAWRLPARLREALTDLSRQEGTTLFMTLMAAYKAFLSRYTGQQDIVVGSPIANRNRAELEGLIGFFVNTLAFRTDLSGDPSFLDLLRRVREGALGAYAHQDLPFETILDELHLQRDLSRTPLVQAAFALQNAPSSALDLPDLTLSPLDVENATAKTDLILFMSEGAAGLRGLFEYNADLFEASTIAKMAEDFEAVLEAVVADPQRRLSTLPPSRPPTRAAQTREDDRFAELYPGSNLTMNQQVIWAAQTLQPDAPLYNMVHTFTIPIRLDRDHFQRAVQTLINSSDALRTVFVEEAGVPQQQVVDDLQYDVLYLDFSQEPAPRAVLQEWVQTRCQIPLPLTERLFDTALIKMAEDTFVWYLNQHHIICDAWSTTLVFRRVAEFYERSLDGELPERVDLPAFQNYLAHEQGYRNSPRHQEAKAYWKKKLANAQESIRFYGQTPRVLSTRVQRRSCALGAERTERLKELAAREPIFTKTINVSLFNIFAALLYTYLHHVSDSREIAIGAAFHNRHTPAFRETLGIFMEVHPLQVAIERDDTFLTLIRKVADEAVETLPHSQCALSQKTYDVFLNYQTVTFPQFCGVPVQQEWIHPGHENDALALQVHDFGASGNIVLHFDFHCDIFEEDLQDHAIQHFMQVLDAFLLDYQRPIRHVTLLGDAERQRVLAGFNPTGAAFPDDQTLSQMFVDQVQRTPDKVASVHNGRPWTFRKINEQANQLAHFIRRLQG